ncbi:transcriptional regulator [Acidovorax sp. Leaf160]|nr:transcriptional regulator [Acidovorax sp. Leaf160]
MMHTTAEIEALQTVAPARQQRRHQGRELRYEGTRMECAHCGAKSVIRHGRVVSKTMREVIYQCTDVECGHCFVVMAETVRSLTPSGKPDPTVTLPLSKHLRRGLVRVLLDNAADADHVPLTDIEPTTGDLFASASPPADTT